MRIDLEQVVTLDWETYYDQQYSLRSKALNTSEYIRHPQFLAHCVGLAIGTAAPRVVWYEDIPDAINEIDWSDRFLLCHNTAFDGLILSHHYGKIPKLYLDTMSMGRGLHGSETRVSLDALAAFFGLGNKVKNVLGKMKGHRRIPDELRADASAYTEQDVMLCRLLFARMIDCYPDAEIELIDWTIRQFADPILRVDVPRAQAALEREIKHKENLVFDSGVEEDDLQSAARLAACLTELGVEVPMKTSPRTNMITYAFSQQDDEFMALAAHPEPKVRALIAARLAVKSTIGESRAQRFVNNGPDKLPIAYNYYGAHTGRWSGGNKMNPQNLEKEERDDAGAIIPLTGELRKCILAPRGHVLVVADSGQIEARITAWMARQEDLLQLFRAGGDPYCALATDIYERVITKADRDQRAVGKAGVLGLGFYMGAPRFQGTLALGILGPKILMELKECEKVVNAYRKKNHKIVALWGELFQMIRLMWSMNPAHVTNTPPMERNFMGLFDFDKDHVWLPNGMALTYPKLGCSDEGEYSYVHIKEYARLHPGILIENIVQAYARVIIGEQLLRINKRYRVVMMSHDEIIAVVPEEEAREALGFMISEMSTSPTWAPDLPLAAEGGYDVCYSK